MLTTCSYGALEAVRVSHQHSKGAFELDWDLTSNNNLRTFQVIRSTEKAHLWLELVFLYVKYDEFVSEAC